MRNEINTRWHTLVDQIAAGNFGYVGEQHEPTSFVERMALAKKYGSPIKREYAIKTYRGYPNSFDYEALKAWVASTHKHAPKILIDHELAEAVNTDFETSMETLKGLRSMDLLGLPYDFQMVELVPSDGSLQRRFAYFQTITDELRPGVMEGFQLDFCSEDIAAIQDYDVLAQLVELTSVNGQPLVVFDPNVFALRMDDNAEESGGSGFGLHYKSSPTGFLRVNHSVNRACVVTCEESVRVLGNALATLYLMMKTRGVERTEIAAPQRFNKNRIARRVTEVPAVTHIHLKHIFDKTGSKAVKPRYASATGSHMPGLSKPATGDPCRVDGRKALKLVRGHPRMQPHGAGRVERKQIFIQPFFRNLEAGEALAKPGPALRLGL